MPPSLNVGKRFLALFRRFARPGTGNRDELCHQWGGSRTR